MFPLDHTMPYVTLGLYDAVKYLEDIQCRMFLYSDWATTHILKNIPDSLGDIERVKNP